MSFVFSHFLASFPLFFIFSSPLPSPARRDSAGFPLAEERRGAALRHNGFRTTTMIGYQRSHGLSSEKARKGGGTVSNLPAVPGQGTPANGTSLLRPPPERCERARHGVPLQTSTAIPAEPGKIVAMEAVPVIGRPKITRSCFDI